MDVEFFYRENGSPALRTVREDGKPGTESRPVGYNNFATLKIGSAHYVAFGQYFEGDVKAEKVYRLLEQV